MKPRVDKIYINYNDRGISKRLLCVPNQGAAYSQKDLNNALLLTGKLNAIDGQGCYEVVYE